MALDGRLAEFKDDVCRRVRCPHMKTHNDLWPAPLGDHHMEERWNVWRDGADRMQAESDGEQQAETRDSVSTPLCPVSSLSLLWLTRNDILTKYDLCIHNRSNSRNIWCFPSLGIRSAVTLRWNLVVLWGNVRWFGVQVALMVMSFS